MQNNYNQLRSNFYPYRVWVLTVSISPLLFCLYAYIIQNEFFLGFNDFILMIFMSIIFGLIFSIPTSIIEVITYYVMIKLNCKKDLIKLATLIIGVVCIITTFSLIKGTILTLELMLVYSFVWSIFSIILSPIKKVN